MTFMPPQQNYIKYKILPFGEEDVLAPLIFGSDSVLQIKGPSLFNPEKTKLNLSSYNSQPKFLNS